MHCVCALLKWKCIQSLLRNNTSTKKEYYLVAVIIIIIVVVVAVAVAVVFAVHLHGMWILCGFDGVGKQ